LHRQKPETNKKYWDLFGKLPPKRDLSVEKSDARVDLVIKWVKLLVCILVFVVVLATGIMAKGSVLFMTAQISKSQVIENCNRNIDPCKKKTLLLSL